MKNICTLVRTPFRLRTIGIVLAGVAVVSAGSLAVGGLSASASDSSNSGFFGGQAFAVSANATLLGQPLIPTTYIQNTGVVSSASSSTTPTPCALNPIIRNVLVSGDLCANVTTSTDPEFATAHASVANLALGLLTLPAIVIQGVASSSTSNCATAYGSTTIAYLKIGSTVVIAKPTAIAPNSKISVGVVNLVLNQQIPATTNGTTGLTVNAIALNVNALGLAQLNLVVASSSSYDESCVNIT